MKVRIGASIAFVGILGIALALTQVQPQEVHQNVVEQAPVASPVAWSEPAAQVASSTILFVGDMMFDRYIRERGEVMGYTAILEGVCATTSSYNLTVGNLEGPVTTLPPVSGYRDGGPNHYTFTFSTTSLEALTRCGFDAVSVGNNHIRNFGGAGLTETRNHLRTAGLGMFGDPDDPTAPLYLTTPTGKVALYAFNQFNPDSPELIAARIRTEATSTFVVVMPHWGEEYRTVASARERARAHLFVDAGADLVVGAHPHVIQDHERYRGSPIYYSLGNFVFDQYFSPEVRCGLALEVEFSEYGVETREHTVVLEKDGRTRWGPCSASTTQQYQSSS